MAVINTLEVFNPMTGLFGQGNVQFFPATSATTTTTYTFVIPAGVAALRARVWGGGGYAGGSGGGFAIKAIYDLSGVTSVVITVGAGGNVAASTGGTSSFGAYVSATGGATSAGAVGTGVGGDRNYVGGVGVSGGGGGGAAGIFGNGGTGGGGNGSAGGGAPAGTTYAGNGFLGHGGYTPTNATYIIPVFAPQATGTQDFSIDFIATGGGSGTGAGVNGSGGGGTAAANTSNNGGFPGGGMGQQATITTGYGGPGLVIVEW